MRTPRSRKGLLDMGRTIIAHRTHGCSPDPKQAEATRKAVFSEAAQKGVWIAAAHISFPGLGHLGTRE
jgi:hypothetical protein